MHNTPVFDAKAEMYDREFTDSYVGCIQRKKIHHLVKHNMGEKKELSILELNCGTGPDISFLKGFGKVLATDVSIEMLKIASAKNPDIQTQYLDLNSPIYLSQKFDLIFSNFGGFNCIDEKRLSEINNELADHLNSRGRLIIVMMHKWSLTEFLYFLLKLHFKKSFRRLNGKSTFTGANVYYYSKSKIKKIFSRFQLMQCQPIGVLLAGEYMNKPGRKLRITDASTKWLSPLFGADHTLYIFEVR